MISNIKIVGTGLIGTSLGLALAREGIVAGLTDQSRANLRLAIEYGAGVEAASEPDLIVVCVPPDLTVDVICGELERHPNALVTDVASVKSTIAASVEKRLPQHSARYLGSHPMAGREKGGPGSARADLFFARPWVITPRDQNTPQQIEAIRELANRCGALVNVMSCDQHDQAVALVSHLPQLTASLLAGQLVNAEEQQLALTGQGLRDTIRIAASDPDLWVQIVGQNASAIAPLITKLRISLQGLEGALGDLDQIGALAKLHEMLTLGNRGIERVPGKHGGKYLAYSVITAVIDDSPGALARLLTYIGEIGVNLEDLKLEHSPGAQIGLVEISVLPQRSDFLTEKLIAGGWRLV